MEHTWPQTTYYDNRNQILYPIYPLAVTILVKFKTKIILLENREINNIILQKVLQIPQILQCFGLCLCLLPIITHS